MAQRGHHQGCTIHRAMMSGIPVKVLRLRHLKLSEMTNHIAKHWLWPMPYVVPSPLRILKDTKFRVVRYPVSDPSFEFMPRHNDIDTLINGISLESRPI